MLLRLLQRRLKHFFKYLSKQTIKCLDEALLRSHYRFDYSRGDSIHGFILPLAYM